MYNWTVNSQLTVHLLIKRAISLDSQTTSIGKAIETVKNMNKREKYTKVVNRFNP